MSEDSRLEPSEVKRRQRENEVVARWNAAHHVGTAVRYWTGIREGDGVESVTRTPAQMLHGHTAVVWMVGESSCVALTHVEPIQVEQPMSPTPTPSGADMEPIAKGVRIEGPARQELAEQVAAAYHDGKSIRVIAAQLGRSYGSVHRLLGEAGVELRSRGARGGR